MVLTASHKCCHKTRHPLSYSYWTEDPSPLQRYTGISSPLIINIHHLSLPNNSLLTLLDRVCRSHWPQEMVKSRNQQAVQATSSLLLPWGPAILLFSCVIHAHASSLIVSDRRPFAASNLRFPDRPKALPPLLKASLRTVLSPLSRARRKKLTFPGADSLLPSTSCSFPVPSLLACRGGSTGATPAHASSSPRNRTAEWEEDAAWLTNQVLTYQAHMALSAEALGKRHAVVGHTPFDFGFKHEEKYR